MPQAQTRAAEKAAEATKLAREKEKEDLLFQLATIASRLDGLEELKEEKRARLESLMSDDGDRFRTSAYGTASFGSRRHLKVADKAACKRFTKEVLIEHFDPPISFFDACARTGVATEGALILGHSPTFTFERASTKDAKSFKKKIIEETKEQTEAKIEAMVRMLRRQAREEE